MVYKLCNYELVLVDFYIVKCPNQVLDIQNVWCCPLNLNLWPTPTSCRCWWQSLLVAMVYFIIRHKLENWQRFNGQFYWLNDKIVITHVQPLGQLTIMGRKFIPHNLRLIVWHMCFTTHVAFAQRVASMSRFLYPSVLKGYVLRNSWLNVQPVIVGTHVSELLHIKELGNWSSWN
jgi:hypothetical protein